MKNVHGSGSSSPTTWRTTQWQSLSRLDLTQEWGEHLLLVYFIFGNLFSCFSFFHIFPSNKWGEALPCLSYRWQPCLSHLCFSIISDLFPPQTSTLSCRGGRFLERRRLEIPNSKSLSNHQHSQSHQNFHQHLHAKLPTTLNYIKTATNILNAIKTVNIFFTIILQMNISTWNATNFSPGWQRLKSASPSSTSYSSPRSSPSPSWSSSAVDGRSPEFYELAHVHPGAELSVFGRLPLQMIFNPPPLPPSAEYPLPHYHHHDQPILPPGSSEWLEQTKQYWGDLISNPLIILSHFSKFVLQEKGGHILDGKLRIFREVLTNMNIQVHGGDGHPPPHSLQRVPSTGPTMSQSTRTPWTSSSSYS